MSCQNFGDIRVRAQARAEAAFEKAGPPCAAPPNLPGRFGHPDLHFNRAHLRRYVEDYGGAAAPRAVPAGLD